MEPSRTGQADDPFAAHAGPSQIVHATTATTTLTPPSPPPTPPTTTTITQARTPPVEFSR